MATIEMTNGTMYILGPDNSYELIGKLNEIEEVYTGGFADEQSYISMPDLTASFECIAKLSKEAIMALWGIRETVLRCCPNKRVVHLALYGRTKRIRKKNFNRAIRILEYFA